MRGTSNVTAVDAAAVGTAPWAAGASAAAPSAAAATGRTRRGVRRTTGLPIGESAEGTPCRRRRGGAAARRPPKDTRRDGRTTAGHGEQGLMHLPLLRRFLVGVVLTANVAVVGLATSSAAGPAGPAVPSGVAASPLPDLPLLGASPSPSPSPKPSPKPSPTG